MGSFIANLATKLSKADQQPVVRINRCIPLIGRAHVMIFVPKAIEAGFQNIALAKFVNASVSIAQADGKFVVSLSTVNSPLAIVSTQEEAAEVVRQLAAVVAPGKRRYVIGGVLLAAGVMVFWPSSQGSAFKMAPSPYPQSSMSKPVAPAFQYPLTSPGQQSQLVTPQSVQAQAQAAAPVQPTAQTDVNDPFGLRVTGGQKR